MSISLKAKNILFFLLLFIFVAVVSILTSISSQYGLYAFGISFLVLIFFFLFFYPEVVVYFLFFSIPLSISLEILPGSTVNLPSEILVAILSLSVGVFFIMRPKKYTLVFKSPITWFLLAEVGWMLISSIYSQMPGVSVKRVIVRVCYIAVYYLFVAGHLAQPRKIFFFIGGYAAGVIYPVIHTLMAHSHFNFSTNAAYMMSLPFYKDHTIYGCVLAFLCCFLGVLIIRYKSVFPTSRWRNVWVVLFLILLTGLFFSYSRAAWLSVVGVLIFSVCLKYKVNIGAFIFVLALGAGLVFVFQKQLLNTFQKTEAESNKGDVTNHMQSVANIRSDASNTERLNRWVCAYRMFLDKPVTGFGIGTFQFYYGKYQSRNYVTRISTFAGTKGHAHSEYLGALSETGLPGFIIFVLLVFTIIRTGMKLYYRLTEEKDRVVVLACLLALVSFYIHAVFNGFMDTDKMASLVLAAMAGITVVYHKEYTRIKNVHSAEV